MNVTVYLILNSISDGWRSITSILEPILRDLDPSLFQNIILGILAIFIPFAIVFLTDILGLKKPKSDFDGMVLSEEVLGTTKVFWLAVTGIFILAFFSGADISNTRKIVAIFVSIVLIATFWKPFRKILRFSEGHKPEFELSFLKHLKIPNNSRIEDRNQKSRVSRAWSSFWVKGVRNLLLKVLKG